MNEASTTWALVVGIDQYDSTNVPLLHGAVADALAAVSWLRKLCVPDGQILLHASAGSGSGAALQTVALPHAPARQADIAASIYRLSQVVGGTRLLVFLCGHGFYEPSSGQMFLVQDFDTNGQWPNLGIDAYVQKFLSLPFRRQFLFMDGCLNYPYPETMRQRFQAMGPVGGAPVTLLPYATIVTCFAASVGERASERNGRGLFLSSLLPQLDPSDPVPDCLEALSYSFDQGTLTVDLNRLMDPFITQQVQAATGGAQHPRVFVKGAGESVDGAQPLFRVLPDPDTVTVSLTVDPPHAAVDVKQLSVWIEDPPFPRKYLYQPPPLVVPVQTRLPRGARGIATCDLPPAAPWDLVTARWPFKADADQTVAFTLTARPPGEPTQPPGGRGRQWFGVKTVTRDGTPYSALTRVGYDEIARVVGLPESPAERQSVGDGVTVSLHEDGPEFMAEPEAAISGAETAAAWAGALRATLPEWLTVTTILRGDVAPKYEKLHFQLPPGGARQLAGPLASHPAVVIERGSGTRPPAWRLTSTPASEPPRQVEKILSLAALEQQPDVSIEPGPMRVSVELPWGSWTTEVQAPASGIEPIDLPIKIGVPPLRVALADDLAYLADRDRCGNPMILGLQGGPPEATLSSLLQRDGTDPEVVAAPSASASWGILQPGLHGVLRLDGLPATLFPLAGRSLAVDRADGVPRVEPLSATTAPEWDLLIGTGQLEVLETEDALNLAREADDELLRLASAYMLYARREWLALGEVLPFAGRPRQFDEALLWLAAIHGMGGSSANEDAAMDLVWSAAGAGQVPVLRWGIDLALTVLTAEVIRRSSTIAAWHAALAAIRPQLSPRSVWTAWNESGPSEEQDPSISRRVAWGSVSPIPGSRGGAVPASREFLHPAFVRKPVEAAAPGGLDYPSTEVGTAGNTNVCYATSLGAPGEELANALLGVVTGPYSDMEALFGVSGGPVTVVVAPLSGNNDGGGGAYHYGCDFTSGGTLYLDATFALPNATDVELALYVAELSECFMGAQGLGWGCGYSNGEGLSRFCAEVDTPPGSFPSWGITGPSWVSAGYPDWVTATEQTDRDYASTGCAVLYLYWLLSLGYTKEQVIQAGGATLADNYQTLTGNNTAYADLAAAVQAVTVTSDNPFGG